MAGYRALGLLSRGLQLPALAPVPNRGGPAAIATEVRRLRALAAQGVRVPQVLAEQPDGFLMADLGWPGQAARSLACELDAHLPQGAAAVLALWQQGWTPWPRCMRAACA